MECKSIQISSSSSSTTRTYDVFVSFRGEDIRNNFADHLFAAFQRKGIDAFRDDKNIKQGEQISTELVQAIEGSKVLIVIFSKNYATSTWCLEELEKIVDCMKVSTGEKVLPVFYDVSPSEVRKQNGDYGKAFTELEKRFEQNLGMVQRWREALEQVPALSGWDIQNKPQNGEIEKIVERVNSILLSYNLSSNTDGLVGMYSRVEQLEKLMVLTSNVVARTVGICGMGGIGKTTLAREVYDRNFHQYGASCFIDDISKIYRDGGQFSVQKELICQTLNEKIQDIRNIPQAKSLIKTRLPNRKALIVLDNVDEIGQLQKLGLNRDCLGAGSRVIVISRDRHILNAYGVDEVYNVPLLNEDEARQLFCRKAFKPNVIMACDDISREYEKLTDRALEYAQCLPLAIEVLGSFLCGRHICEWRSALDRLRDNPKREIMDVLQISFDGLEKPDKEIFLDIACLFNHDSQKMVRKILGYCDFEPKIGIANLIDKSLITIEEFGIIRMHDMLQELGREIVRQNALNEPWKWSRIWCGKDFERLTSEEMAIDNIKAIRLKSEEEEERTTFRAETLSRMNRLRLLILEDVNFSGSLNSLSNDLRYLHWENYPFTYFPSSCQLTKLVKLFLPNSNIKELWKGKMPLDNLKKMDLNGSENLVKIPDLSGAPNLEVLNLKGCTKLERIHPSIGLLRKLVYLYLDYCTSLWSLPIRICDISSLEVVSFKRCSTLFHSAQVKKERHGVNDNSIQCQSTISSIFKRLKLTPSLARLSHLRYLYLSYCNLLNIPEAVASLDYLEILDLSGNNFVTLPCIIKKLPRLRCLDLDHCKQLTSLSEFSLCLPVGTELVDRRNLRARLSIFDCPKLVERESWSGIALSWMIQFLKVHKESLLRIDIVIPETRIPSWFSRQSAGNSITIERFPNVYDNNWIGIALSVVFVARYDPPSSTDAKGNLPWIACYFYNRKGEQVLGCSRYVGELEKTGAVMTELPYLCLFYFTRKELIHFIIHGIEGYGIDVLDGSRFELGAALQLDGLHLEAKNWGMRVVFKQDLEELNGDE